MMLQRQSGPSSAGHWNIMPTISSPGPIRPADQGEETATPQGQLAFKWLLNTSLPAVSSWPGKRKQGGMAPSLLALQRQFIVKSTEINTAGSLPFIADFSMHRNIVKQTFSDVKTVYIKGKITVYPGHARIMYLNKIVTVNFYTIKCAAYLTETWAFFPFIFMNFSMEAKKKVIWTDVLWMGLCSF